MSNSMIIGPAMEIGGNTVEMRTDGKIQVTNPKGKIKTLTQDEFQKQTMKNANKIASGEDFEYKKDNKALKIAGAAVGTAAISLGIIYRKEIGKYMRNFTFKKFWNDLKGLFKSNKNKDVKTPDFKKHNVYKDEKVILPEKYGVDARLEAEKLSKETRKLKNETLAQYGNDLAYDFEMGLEHSKQNHKQIQAELNKALGLKRGQKDNVEITPRTSTITEQIFGAEQAAKWRAQWEKFHPAK